jgi:hypothetical protein
MGFSPAGKDVSRDIIRIHYQETTSEDRRIYVCCCYSEAVIVICSYELCV